MTANDADSTNVTNKSFCWIQQYVRYENGLVRVIQYKQIPTQAYYFKDAPLALVTGIVQQTLSDVIGKRTF